MRTKVFTDRNCLIVSSYFQLSPQSASHEGRGFFIHSKLWKSLLSAVLYCKMRFYLHNEVKIILYFQLLLYYVVLLQNGAYITPPHS